MSSAFSAAGGKAERNFMKFICNRDTLNSAVVIVSRAVSQRSSIAALEGIYIKADESGKVTLRGNDLEIGIETAIDADVSSGGEVVLDAKLFVRIMAAASEPEISLETGDNLMTTIKSGHARIDIPGINAEEFPDLPGVEENYSVVLPAGVLKNMIEMTSFAAAKTDNDPTRMGSLLRIRPGKLSMTALDGYRIAQRNVKISGDFAEKDMIIPEKSLVELAKIIGESDDDVRIVAAASHALFSIGGYMLVTRLIDGSFTNFERIIPDSYELELNCAVRDIADSVRRASLIILNELVKGPIKLKITDANINVSCTTTAGSVDDNISIDTPPGADLTIGFYNRYLQDVFSVIKDDYIMMKFNKSVNPLVITPVEGDDYMYMILPIVLRNYS